MPVVYGWMEGDDSGDAPWKDCIKSPAETPRADQTQEEQDKDRK